jgi:hypothetical protein
MTWLDQAHCAMRHLTSSDEPFTADDLLAIVGHPDADHAANSRNSTIGSLFAQYSSGGKIMPVDVRRSTSPQRKGGLIRVWQRVPPEPMDSLFDASVYGPEPHTRAPRRERPAEIRLHHPWVLLGNHRYPPTAHLLTAEGAPNEDRSWRTRCEKYGYVIKMDGTPMVRVCPLCWDFSQ